MSLHVQFEVGMRVTVFWPDDDEWYKGTVASELEGDYVLIEYDDGEVDWMDVSTNKWRRSTKPDKFIKHDTFQSNKKQKQIAKLSVGSRVSVWWPKDKEYYTGTLTKKKREGDEDGKPHHIRYDDKDEEWTNLLYRKFKRVEAKAERLRVGSRVSVYNEERKRRFRATVTNIKPHKARPHEVKYDKQSKGTEWLNLNAHPFLDIEPCTTAAAPSVKVTACNLRKRKREFLDSQPAEERKQQKVKDNDTAPTTRCEETCGICKSRARRPRATSCHHIFCKRCIQHHCQRVKTCPLCKVVIVNSALDKYDPQHVSYKAVEALKRSTAEVAMSFSSASSASLEKPGLVPSRIIQACQSKRRDDREHLGLYWRFQGSKDRILRVGESIKVGIPIEQVDLQTGEIIEVFPSSRKAYEKTGVSRGTIRRVLERKGKAAAGGFFWRFQGETHGPWPDPEPTNLNPVEQLDFETGDLLKSYVSLAEAKRAMGMRPNSQCIRDVCEVNGRATAKGYFWRWKGSQALPNHMMGVQKIVQIRRTKNGKVAKEFRTSRDAQAYFGHQYCWSTVCRYCREKGYYNGYYWQYRMLRERKSAAEEIIGKRLRVQQPGNRDEWLEGKISSFHSKTGKHEILFDCGTIERHNLEDIRYEWKNDQGQKPVEQLDLKTGQVLATFDSISNAAASVGASEPGHIVAVCMGRYKSSGGFFWRYKGSGALPPKPKAKRKVEQLCLKTGRVIATFDTITSAGKAVGVTTPGISYCCNGRNGSKSAGGFGWRFAKEDD